MRKIEIDSMYGVFEVREFNSFIGIVEEKDVLKYLSVDFYGTYGAEISQELFDKIKKEYGIKELDSSPYNGPYFALP